MMFCRLDTIKLVLIKQPAFSGKKTLHSIVRNRSLTDAAKKMHRSVIINLKLFSWVWPVFSGLLSAGL